MSSAQERTSLGVRRQTHTRLDDLKPYESISWDEFLHEMADVYEENRA